MLIIDVRCNLIFGSSYHTVLEMFFKDKMNNESKVQINEMINLFEYLLLKEVYKFELDGLPPTSTQVT
jgi:hypothetical protein